MPIVDKHCTILQTVKQTLGKLSNACQVPLELEGVCFWPHFTFLPTSVVKLVIIANQGSVFDRGGCLVSGGSCKRNQNQTLFLIWISAAVFISVIAYPPTLQCGTISFFLKKLFFTFNWLIKVHVSDSRPNTDYDPQDILLHFSMSINWLKIGLQKIKVIWKVHWLRCPSVSCMTFKPLLHDTALAQLTYPPLVFKYNSPRISEMTLVNVSPFNFWYMFQKWRQKSEYNSCKKRQDVLNL